MILFLAMRYSSTDAFSVYQLSFWWVFCLSAVIRFIDQNIETLESPLNDGNVLKYNDRT